MPVLNCDPGHASGCFISSAASVNTKSCSFTSDGGSEDHRDHDPDPTRPSLDFLPFI